MFANILQHRPTYYVDLRIREEGGGSPTYFGSPILADILDENAYPRLGCETRHGTARNGSSTQVLRLSRLPVAIKVCLGVELYPRDQTPTIDGERKKERKSRATISFVMRETCFGRSVLLNHVRAFGTRMLNQTNAHVNEIASYYHDDEERKNYGRLSDSRRLELFPIRDHKSENNSVFLY